MPIAALSELQSVLVIGSNLRKDHPLFAQRLRQATRRGCVLTAIGAGVDNWAMRVASSMDSSADAWVAALASVANAVAAQTGAVAPVTVPVNDQSSAIAQALLSGERKALLLGNAAAHHAQASSLLALAQWIAEQTGASFGYLTEAANTVGAQWVGAVPQAGGVNAGDMMGGALKAVLLLGTEPEFDARWSAKTAEALGQAKMVVSLNPFKANMALADVILPVSPFTETSGTFVNAEGRVQSFHAVVKPLGETRPAWKVLRVLANMLNLPGFAFDTSQQVLQSIPGLESGQVTILPAQSLSNRTSAKVVLDGKAETPVVASIYQLDGLVRRAPSLQMTADAKAYQTQGATA
jgi:NADH-quinone oxidoreductase subunit G